MGKINSSDKIMFKTQKKRRKSGKALIRFNTIFSQLVVAYVLGHLVHGGPIKLLAHNEFIWHWIVLKPINLILFLFFFVK